MVQAKNPGTFDNVVVRRGAALSAAALGPEQVLVAPRACCVGYPDLLQTVGGYQHKLKLPYTPGQEACGVVTAVGSGGVRGLAVGDRVQCSTAGALASEVVVPAAGCWVIPDHYSHAEGAAFGVAYSTAYHCLVERANLRAGVAVGETVILLTPPLLHY